jgi:hypothetical protein
MPQRTNAFQTLLSCIYAALHGKRAIVEESAMVRNYDSETDTEIDILITFDMGSNKYRTAIECQDRSRPAGVSWISELKAKRDGCRLSRMIAVHSRGFTKSAKTLAERYGIEALTPKEMAASDSLFKLIDPYTTVALQVTTCSFPEGIVFAFENGTPPAKVDPASNYLAFADGNRMSIAEFDRALGEMVRCIWANGEHDLANKPREELEEKDVQERVVVSFEFQQGTIVRFDDSTQLSALCGRAYGVVTTKILVDQPKHISPKEGVLATHAEFSVMGKKTSVTLTAQEERRHEMGICIAIDDGIVRRSAPVDKRFVGNVKIAITKLGT